MMERFTEPLQVEQTSRTTWRLLAPFSYLDPDFGLIAVPSGVETDFSSVPRIPIVFDIVGAYGHAAAVLHDHLYTTGKLPRAAADRVFLNALRSSGLANWRSWLMYAGVRICGAKSYTKPPTSSGFFTPGEK